MSNPQIYKQWTLVKENSYFGGSPILHPKIHFKIFIEFLKPNQEIPKSTQNVRPKICKFDSRFQRLKEVGYEQFRKRQKRISSGDEKLLTIRSSIRVMKQLNEDNYK